MADKMTWETLAAALGRNTRDMRTWRKNGAPNNLDLEAWRTWIAGNVRGGSMGSEGVADDAELPGGCDYDDLVKAGKLTYALAKIREQVVSESISNETKRVELAKARGALVTKESAEHGCALVRDAMSQRFDRAVARALSRLADQLTTELRAEISKAIDAEMDAQ